MNRTNQDPDLTEKAMIEAEERLETFFRNRGLDLRESIEILQRELDENRQEMARLRSIISQREWFRLDRHLPEKTIETLSGYDSPFLGDEMWRAFECEPNED